MGDLSSRLGVGDLRHDDRELVPREPRRRDSGALGNHRDAGLGGAQTIGEPGRERLEQCVSGGMTQGVIDLLEVVEVDVEQRAGVTRLRGVGEIALELIQEEPAVRQPREAVVVRESDEILLVAVALADVADQQGADVVRRAPLHGPPFQTSRKRSAPALIRSGRDSGSERRTSMMPGRRRSPPGNVGADETRVSAVSPLVSRILPRPSRTMMPSPVA